MIALYEARITFGLPSLLALLIVPGYVLLGSLMWLSRDTMPAPQEVRMIFELGLTLSAGFAAAHLMTIEREEGFDEIRRTYPEHNWRVPLLRSAQIVLFVIAAGLIAAGMLLVVAGGYPLRDTLIPALAPAIWLAALAMLVNNVSGSYWIAVAVAAGYWMGEALVRGAYSGSFFLFNHAMPKPDVDPVLNRALLLGLALVAFALNTAYSSWRRRGTVGR